MDCKQGAEWLVDLTKKMSGNTQNLVANVGTKAQVMVEEKTPVESGKLRDNWKSTDVERVGNGYRMTIYNDTEYAMNQEIGGITPTGGVYHGSHMVQRTNDELVGKVDSDCSRYLNGVLK